MEVELRLRVSAKGKEPVGALPRGLGLWRERRDGVVGPNCQWALAYRTWSREQMFGGLGGGVEAATLVRSFQLGERPPNPARPYRVRVR